MRLNTRRVLIGVPLVIAAIPIAYLMFLYGFGRFLVPPLEPATAPVTPLFAESLWANAGGGRETELRPLNPIGMFRFATCTENAQHLEDPQQRLEDGFECRKHLPGLHLREHLANQHVGDQALRRNSFRGGAASFSTMLGFSSSWTKDEFLRTVAARARFGHTWRGSAEAARALFDRELAELTLPQAAYLAARSGTTGPDPLCEPNLAVKARNRVLSRMLENGAISESQYREAAASPLGLRIPPPDLRPCM
jgi:Transglycosylase